MAYTTLTITIHVEFHDGKMTNLNVGYTPFGRSLDSFLDVSQRAKISAFASGLFSGGGEVKKPSDSP